VLLPHLLVQALLVGGAALLPFAPDAKLAVALLVLAVLHHGLGLLERIGHHDTHNAQMAAALLPTIPAWRGSRFPAFHGGMALTTAASAVAMLLVLAGAAAPTPLALCAVLGWIGLYFYEHAYVQAGQLPPLS
jgi:MFS family permease